MYNAIVQVFTIIGRFRHVVGAAIFLFSEHWSGAGSDDLFELRNHVLEKGSPRIKIGEFLCIPTLEVFDVHEARLVELDEGILD